jgi:hypothetical protein
MALKSQAKPSAPGGPGIGPRWTRGAKVTLGTAYSTSSRVWYALDSGCVTDRERQPRSNADSHACRTRSFDRFQAAPARRN